MEPGLSEIADSTPSSRQASDEWVDAHADMLYRHALRCVRESAAAQDLVQEVFLAAWRSRQAGIQVRFEKAWLLGILRKKIADYFRRSSKEMIREEDLSDFERQQFQEPEHDGHEHWRREPRDWNNPQRDLERSEFWQVLDECADKLPRRTARAFLLRELEELSAAEIGEILDLQPNHVFVMLHRARLALRRCLEVRWFGSPGRDPACD